MPIEQQVQDNATAILELQTNAKKINEVARLNTNANLEDLLLIYRSSLNKTVAVTLAEAISEKATNFAIEVNGNLFILRKHPNNNDPTKIDILEQNDMIYSGWWDTTTWWPEAIYLGGDKDTLGSWNVFNPIDGIPII